MTEHHRSIPGIAERIREKAIARVNRKNRKVLAYDINKLTEAEILEVCPFPETIEHIAALQPTGSDDLNAWRKYQEAMSKQITSGMTRMWVDRVESAAFRKDSA